MPRHLSHALGAVLGALTLLLLLAGPASAKPSTVTISGKAYVFNHMDQFIPGATIRVRELPKLSTTTDVNGDYELEVPDNTTVTPYIDPPAGYNEIDLQTFHTRGKNIANANFQTPADLEYNALRVLLDVPFGSDGRPAECAIVTTASARNVRGVDYQTFEERTPHGVAGATSVEFPEIPGPTYFNASVIPDPTETSTSEDGGIIWTRVPTGTYRIATSSPTARFASFLATCEPGRVINANPPWGAYELFGEERPVKAGLAAVDISARGVRSSRSGVRSVRVRLRAGEQLSGKLVATTSKKRFLVRERIPNLEVGGNRVTIALPGTASSGRVRLTATFRDAAGGKVTDRTVVRFPRGAPFSSR